jgi:hypothetical protein
MNLVETYVDKSEIAGLGLFAKQFIPKGTFIWRLSFPDLFISKEEYNKLNLSKVEKEYMDTYSSFEKGFVTIYADNAKYSNHSNKANTVTFDNMQVALYDINIGEEITSNYHEFDDELDGTIYLK